MARSAIQAPSNLMHVVRMLIDAVLRAARILQSQPGYSMPLLRLHAQLVHELGADAGSYRQIYQQLKKRIDSFIIADMPRVLGGTDGWPGGVREAYESALDHAGLGSCVRITLTETPAQGKPCDLLAALGATLADLAINSAADDELAAYVERGSQQLLEMSRIIPDAETARPTTPLPDPPPAM